MFRLIISEYGHIRFVSDISYYGWERYAYDSVTTFMDALFMLPTHSFGTVSDVQKSLMAKVHWKVNLMEFSKWLQSAFPKGLHDKALEAL